MLWQKEINPEVTGHLIRKSQKSVQFTPDYALEMVYRGLYFLGQAVQRGEAADLLSYLIVNAKRLGLLKRTHKRLSLSLLQPTFRTPFRNSLIFDIRFFSFNAGNKI